MAKSTTTHVAKKELRIPVQFAGGTRDITDCDFAIASDIENAYVHTEPITVYMWPSYNPTTGKAGTAVTAV